MEIFAGTARMANAFAEAGVNAESWEVRDGPGGDFLRRNNRRRLERAIRKGGVGLVWFGMDCDTWSIARRNDGRGPGPVRSSSELDGLADLGPRDAFSVRRANLVLRLVGRLARLCILHGVPFVLENPLTSRVWLHAIIHGLLRRGATFTDLDFCQFQARWKKGTRLLSWGFPGISAVAKRCHLVDGKCSASGLRHVWLAGKDSNHSWMTKRAQAYPIPFCRAVAEAAVLHFDLQSTPPPP